MLQIVERKINMKTIKVKKHEVEKVISLLKKHEGSEEESEDGNYHWCA